MSPPVRYAVAAANPNEHLYDVEVRFPNTAEYLDAWMPVWTPGSYLVREFSRHVQDLTADDGAGKALPVERTSKNAWRVTAKGAREVRLRYRVYANEVTVRTSHLDSSHAYFNGANLFVSSDAHREAPCHLSLRVPAGFTAFCALPQKDGAFVAKNFDELIDSPVEMGPHEPLRFTAAGKPHEIVIWGRGNEDRAQLVKDVQAICEEEAKIFGGLPFEKYLFIVLLSDRGRGGLEHAASTALLYSRWGFRPKKSYEEFLSLVAHEYFHLWNVKRIKPKALVPFDYQKENYTKLLWAMEGITSYYDTWLLRRAGIIDAERYLTKMGEAISSIESIPAKKVQSLADASWCAWIKYYRQDENTANSGISYYVKGEVVGMLLDLHIRKATAGRKSLDDVMRVLFERYGDGSGVPEDGVEAVVREVGGEVPAKWLSRVVNTTEDVDYSVFEAAGLTLKKRGRESSTDKGGHAGTGEGGSGLPYLGCDVKGSDAAKVTVVYSGTAAAKAGISYEDEIVAVDGWRVNSTTLFDRLEERKAGDKVKLTLFRRDELMTLEVTLAERPLDAFFIEKLPKATAEQKALYEAWLKEPFEAQGNA